MTTIVAVLTVATAFNTVLHLFHSSWVSKISTVLDNILSLAQGVPPSTAQAPGR